MCFAQAKLWIQDEICALHEIKAGWQINKTVSALYDCLALENFGCWMFVNHKTGLNLYARKLFWIDKYMEFEFVFE